ncbi:MAG TPA: FHA domain-containing protein [Clostridia bacterium]|nr:FHA domain-containing protein [Clostridia bacterium]HOS19488.1 FHA domain-containing protein [Clostridia bacterium]HPK14917.1 FHA domain-containing protein [Clostridia bacterium]
MNETAYSVAASVMRYLFVVLLAFVIFGAIARSVLEGRRLRAARRVAGLSIRALEILAPERYKGKWFPLCEDTYIGSAEDCDVPLPHTDLRDEHARIFCRHGDAVLQTRQRRFCEVNGAKPARRTALSDGDVVWMQDVCFACRKRMPGAPEVPDEQD